MLEMAEKLGLKVIFYDDINFPTGTAGGRLAKQYPDSTAQEPAEGGEEIVARAQGIELAVPKAR